MQEAGAERGAACVAPCETDSLAEPGAAARSEFRAHQEIPIAVHKIDIAAASSDPVRKSTHALVGGVGSTSTLT